LPPTTPSTRKNSSSSTSWPLQEAETTSENTTAALEDYQRALRAAPLSDETRRTYLSKVRGYLTWLAAADADGDPLTQARARARAVRDYRTTW
jgi:hypothetical protein